MRQRRELLVSLKRKRFAVLSVGFDLIWMRGEVSEKGVFWVSVDVHKIRM
jgi:hypothetical protein